MTAVVVILLSPNRGKLRTVAKGVRTTKSRFGGRLEPCTHVDLVREFHVCRVNESAPSSFPYLQVDLVGYLQVFKQVIETDVDVRFLSLHRHIAAQGQKPQVRRHRNFPFALFIRWLFLDFDPKRPECIPVPVFGV